MSAKSLLVSRLRIAGHERQSGVGPNVGWKRASDVDRRAPCVSTGKTCAGKGCSTLTVVAVERTDRNQGRPKEMSGRYAGIESADPLTVRELWKMEQEAKGDNRGSTELIR